MGTGLEQHEGEYWQNFLSFFFF